MKLENDKLLIWNSESKAFEEEKVFGQKAIEFLYNSSVGKIFLPLITRNKWVSQAYGWLQSQPTSAKKIPDFVRDFGIKLDEFEGEPYATFNDFFVRKFKKGLRPFATGRELPAPCEARYTLIEKSSPDLRLGVKGALLSPGEILGDKELAKRFESGPMAIARLCPIDYHRFHFVDRGAIVDSRRISGSLDSVNPLSLLSLPHVLYENERHLTLTRNEVFGDIAFVDVGATCVGKIVQNKSVGESFERGDERGYFLFGGSTVVIFGTPNAWSWNKKLLEKCNEGWEVWVPLGKSLGTKSV